MPAEQRSLARAFRSFTEAAGSLERPYGQLHAEVARLRRELQETNRDLAVTLEENQRIRAHLSEILENLPCGVLVVKADGAISIANPESRRLLGISPDVRLRDLTQVPEDSRQSLESARHGVGEQECARGPSGGEAQWMAVRHNSVNENQGASSVFILRDLNQQKQMEREREALRRQHALAEMSTLLAHEIRNPLGSMELFAGLLAEAELSREGRRWLDHLRAGLRTLAATVNNVLHFHSLPQPELAPTNLGELLRWTCDFLRPLAVQAGVQMQLHNGAEEVWIVADRQRLQQVMLNLALNAFRFLPEGGLILISGVAISDAGHDFAQLELADTGPGITPENLARIFEPGFTTRQGSPGLGLAVCKKIVEQHGGTIAVASQPGFGARFTLRFPRIGAAA